MVLRCLAVWVSRPFGNAVRAFAPDSQSVCETLDIVQDASSVAWSSTTALRPPVGTTPLLDDGTGVRSAWNVTLFFWKHEAAIQGEKSR